MKFSIEHSRSRSAICQEPDSPRSDRRESRGEHRTTILLATMFAIMMLGLLAEPFSAQLLAQAPGGLEVPDSIFIENSRVIVLPPARKGEVFDTTLYVLPPGDSLIFGNRITNLEGDGGLLPVYGEFDSPLTLNAEASIGTFISPRGRLSVEYAVENWNARALLDLRSTAGHVDGAEASGIMIAADGEYLIPGQLPSPGKARAGVGVDYLGDSYNLYGWDTTGLGSSVPDRRRTIFNIGLNLASETDAEFDYGVALNIESAAVDDSDPSIPDSSSGNNALSPKLDLRFRYGTDSLNIGAYLRYQSTSLGYSTLGTGMRVNDPDFVEIGGQVEFSPGAGFVLSAGGFFATGDHSDSDTLSSTLIMARAGLRYQLNQTISIFGEFNPELRFPSYRSRIMLAPYVLGQIPLRPERVPIAVEGGLRVDLGRFGLEGGAFFETAENTPVVVADSVMPGVLRYTHVDSRTFGLRGLIRANAGERIDLLGEVTLSNSVDTDDDQQLPMRPALEAMGKVDLDITDRIGVFGSLTFQSEQYVMLNQPSTVETLDPRFLIGGGADYQIIDNFQLFAEVTNLLGLGYDLWQGYQGPGLEVRVGGRGRF